MTTPAILKFVGHTHNADGNETIAAYEHRLAIDHRYKSGGRQHGRALRYMLDGWATYARASLDEFGFPIGEDGVLGQHWQAIGISLCRLLDGPTGGWDCGSLNANIRRLMADSGCEVPE